MSILFINLHKFSTSTEIVSEEVEIALEYMKQMATTINKLETVCDNSTEYNKGLYYSRYILTLAFCLPSKRINTQSVIEIEVNDNYSTLFADHVDSFKKWQKDNTILSREQIIEYINKKREEDKNKDLNEFNKLSDEERALRKDMKRFGLKVDQGNPENTHANNDEHAEAARDQQYEDEGRREFTFRTSDPDQTNMDNMDDY
jgi:hypothetical protein